MDRQLAVEYYTFGVFMNGVGGIFSLIGTIVVIFFNDSLMKINVTAMVVVFVILCLIMMAMLITMMMNSKLRRNKPWNAIITVSYAIVAGFMIMMLLFVEEAALKNLNSAVFIWLLFAFFPAWFIGICFVNLAMAIHAKYMAKSNDGWAPIFCAFLAFLIPFLPFYSLISLSLTQSSWAIVISAIFFVILGFLCIFFLVKRTANKIAKYLEKCDEMNQEPTVYDLLYKFN